MTINNEKAYLDGVWDWAMFDGCFGQTRITPTDIDGIVERHGRFYVLEAKATGVPVPEGQMRTFKALVNLQVFTILIMWGEKNKPEKAMVMTRHGVKEFPVVTVEFCRRLTSRWFEFAESF